MTLLVVHYNNMMGYNDTFCCSLY